MNGLPNRYPPPASLAHVARVWFGLGIQSFGGGVATLALIRRAAVEQEQWVTEQEFTRFWSLCQVAPGINLFALTILIGRKAAGAPGVMAALIGLLLPSVTITILMSAAYTRVREAPAMRHALRGLLPATVGLGLVAAFQVARPLAAAAYNEGWDTLIVSAFVLVGAGAAIGHWHLPVVAALLASGMICALHAWLRGRFTRAAAGS